MKNIEKVFRKLLPVCDDHITKIFVYCKRLMNLSKDIFE